tara:strand:- start:14410 stop:15546 length:1137 start_codon:yes stop_codon:yes gene_type:complete
MRIAVNTRLLVPGKMDGIGRFTFESLKIIAQENPEDEFVFIFDRKPPSEFKFGDNVELVSIGPPARHPILWYIWFEHRLPNFINKGHFDLFLSPEGWISPRLNCPSLGVIHDLNFVHSPENIIYSHRKYLEIFFPKFAKRANRIATVSEYSKKDITETYGIKSNQIDVVYNGANQIFQPIDSITKKTIQEDFSQGQPYFIFIGTLHPRKNLENLFIAFNEFKKKTKSDIKLLIVGNKKWWPNSLENTYQNLEHKTDIIFCGRQSDEMLAKLLGGAEALTYLPFFEGFGIPILEAFQAEVPVITSNTTSMPEVAKGGAILCNPTDVKAISDAMLEILEDKTLRKKLIEIGNQRAQDFSWKKTADLLWDSMLKTINQKGD